MAAAAEPMAAAAEAPPASGAGQTIIGDEDEPIIMRLRSTPTPSQHRRPSPHPRTGAHDRVRRNRPGRRPAEDAPAADEPAVAPAEAAETSVVPAEAPAEAPPEEYTIPEAGSALVAPPAEPEIEWWTDSSYPDRETEHPPSRAEAAGPTVIEGELADEPEPEPAPTPTSTGSAWGNGRGPVPVGASFASIRFVL